MPNANFFDYQTGVPTKLVSLADGSYAPAVEAFAPLAPAEYDAITLGYTGSNLTTVQYRVGGTSGTVVVTLTLTYDGSNNLTSVARS